MGIRKLKTVYYKLESAINEPYDKTDNFIELKMSEYTPETTPEIIETEQMSHLRQLATRKSTGRKTGSLKIVKPLDGSLLAIHSGLIGSGLGELTVAGSPITVTGVTADTITASSTGYVAGDIVQITADNRKFKHLLVESADASSVTFKNVLTAQEIAVITAGTTKTVKKLSKCKIGSPQQSNTYTVVVIYDDSSVEVYTGCGVACSFDVNTSGEAKFNIEFKASRVDFKDEFGTYYEIPSGGTITQEGRYNNVKYDFKSSLLYDPVLEDDKSLFPQVLALKIAHTLEANSMQGGGLNNIEGFYTSPSVECEANFHYNTTNRRIFSDDYENISEQYYFCSQSDFSFYAPHCSFIGLSDAEINVYDSINLKMNINDDADNEPIICLPQ